ncbi:MAG: acyl-phosphate glycerol 3-phosphate acyltransferase [Coxiella sp. RIFCSPHIGHO2_12_FULL_42_15]|nr:MAG: acyl-phosphate glycerol 3-phosphate acyltransferase [Coxiella sp. RIFCSPHIGHO2_12_FULL_42_15]
MGFIVSVVIAYLLGSISCAILVAKFLNLPDPRTQGSGNAGATNMLRTSGTKAGIMVLIGDVLKGIIAIVIGYLFHVKGFGLGLVGLAAVIGHIFPLFFKFKGGKGVATAAGALLAISFWTFIFVLISWGIVLFITRFVSLASIIAGLAAPIYLLIGGNYVFFVPFALVSALIIWKHSSNIQRLRAGTEGKVKFG